MPIFRLESIVDKLSELGYPCKIGSMRGIKPEHRPYLERWLENRDGFIAMERGNIDYIGIEEVVRMGPFFNIYCLIENDSLSDNDDNSHNLLDTNPYFRLHNGTPTNLGWSGGVLSNVLAKDIELSQELAKNIMNEEFKRISVKARNYACVIETVVWDPAGLAAVFNTLDRIAMHVRDLVNRVHFGEEGER